MYTVSIVCHLFSPAAMKNHAAIRILNVSLHQNLIPFHTHRRVHCAQISRGAWGALEAVASDSGGGVAHTSATGGGGRHRKTVDTARDLLTLPCVDVQPVDLVTCYERCCSAAPVAGERAAVGAIEVRARCDDMCNTHVRSAVVVGEARSSS